MSVNVNIAQGHPRARILACMREQYEEGHSIDDKDAVLVKLQGQGGCTCLSCTLYSSLMGKCSNSSAAGCASAAVSY